MLGILLSVFAFSLEETSKSKFGAPGVDEIENEYVQGIEILERNLPKPSVKPVSEGNFVSIPIADDDYPWPGHDFKSGKAEAINNESTSINAKYNNAKMTQDESYYHPASFANWYTTKEEMDKAERVKIRYTLTSTYEYHLPPVWLPPGEIITIEMPPGVTLQCELNSHIRQLTLTEACPDCPKQRLPTPILKGLTFKPGISTISYPYGANILFWYGGTDPIDVNISGVILCPYFIYGYHSDDDWEDDLKNRPGPYALFDTGNLVMFSYKKFVTQAYFRLNDAMKYWRSAIQISQTTAKDHHDYNNPQYGRIHNPCTIKHETYVPAGEACAFVGGNFIHAPTYWIGSMINYNAAVDNPWGAIHEINHHHQENWGKTQDAGEMSNNAISLGVYSKTNIVSRTRTTDGWGKYTFPSSQITSDETYGLARYSNLLHSFGINKYKEFITSDQQDLYYPRATYGEAGAEMLRASKVYGRDMRYHWNFYHTSDEALGQETLNALKELNLKPYHPVSNVYAVGRYDDNGERIITARPYCLKRLGELVNFSQIVCRDNKEQFGDFELTRVEFENGRSGAWKEITKGAYQVTPKANVFETEEVIVTYHDKTLNENHRIICQFTTMFSTDYLANRLLKYAEIPETEDDLFKAYAYVAKNKNSLEEFVNEFYELGIGHHDYTNSTNPRYLTIFEGRFQPPDSGLYCFAASGESKVAFYLSENTLAGNPDDDEESLLIYQNTTSSVYADSQQANITLDKDKIYDFRLVIYPNAQGKSRGFAGYMFNNSGSFRQVPNAWMRYYTPPTEKELYDNQFVPAFERIYLMDLWNGVKYKNRNQTLWNVYKVPPGGSIMNSNSGQGQSTTLSPSDVLTDGDATTEYRVNWWPSNVAQAFPHEFEIDMGQTEEFDHLRLGKAGNMNYFPMASYLQIHVSDSNSTEDEDSIHNETSLVFEGIYNNTVSEFVYFNKKVSGRYIKLVFLNNSLLWKDGNPGRTCLSTISTGMHINNTKVYPMTNTRYITLDKQWDITNGGEYYNGKGYIGYAASNERDSSSMTIRMPKNKRAIGIIGDYHHDMGRARVELDGQTVGYIGDESYDPVNDERKLTKAHHAYKSLLFYIDEIDPNSEHTVKVTMIQGSITFAGLLCDQIVVDYFTDDGTYEQLLAQEFVNPTSKGGLSGGIIALIVILVLAAVAGTCVGVFFMYKKQVLCFNPYRDGYSSVKSPLFLSV